MKVKRKKERQKNYRHITIMNIDTKIPKETLANSAVYEKNYTHGQIGFIPRMQNHFNIEYQLM